jgi:hypothetical protein
MYAVIRRYEFAVSADEEIRRQVRERFLPLIRETPGLVAYYLLDTGEGQAVSVSVFEGKAGAERSTRLAADFVREHLASVLGQPETIEGEIVAHALPEVPANV